MTRTTASREWPPVGVVRPNPGDRENGAGQISQSSYPEPTPVPLGKKPKACRGTVGKGTRQIGRMSSFMLSLGAGRKHIPFKCQIYEFALINWRFPPTKEFIPSGCKSQLRAQWA